MNILVSVCNACNIICVTFHMIIIMPKPSFKFCSNDKCLESWQNIHVLWGFKINFFYVSFMGKAFKLLIYMYEYVRANILINIFLAWEFRWIPYDIPNKHLYECMFMVARGISIYLFKEESWLFCCYSNFKWFMRHKERYFAFISAKLKENV